MFETLRNAWKIDDLRKKIIYTLLLLLVYRIGTFVPVPGVDRAFIAEMVSRFGILGLLDIINGSSLSNFTIFAMGITPYINASIIMQLLTVAIPKLEALAKEGEEGRKKIAQYTRYFAVVLAFIQSIGIILGLGRGAVIEASFWNYLTIGLTLTAGTAFIIWLGERITENGIGNGMSLIIFVGIIARLPVLVVQTVQGLIAQTIQFWMILLIILGTLIMVAGVVFVDLGQRRIPIQYAKRMVGRKMYGGQSTHIPMKVNSSGVLPLIFAISFVSFPGMITQFWPNSAFSLWYNKYLGTGTVAYGIIYALLIIGFTFFYTTITFNPVEIANNLKQYGGFIPGIRPGKPTSDYLSRISNRITFFGAIFLALVAVLPMIFTNITGMQSPFGATGILIVVSVALETTKQIEAQMLMRHYRGFLK
ncbi:MAG: preprotein translocase subunit SecY [Clostridia bacterium]|jgi:preprotein translocase subunit SecY